MQSRKGVITADIPVIGTRLRIKSHSALNLDFTEWGEAFPNKLLGASTLDRIRHAAYQLVLDGKSYRTPRGEAEAEKSVVAKARKTAK